ncbi:hypothetical protein ACLB1G_03955 [Oxalobacteraceae bacterium A2-2]
MIHHIVGPSISATLAAEQQGDQNKIANNAIDTSNFDLSASLAAYMSLPGYNNVQGAQQASGADNSTDNTAQSVTAATAEDESLKLALQQFDEGLKKLVDRPETQAFQAKFGASQEDGKPAQFPTSEPVEGDQPNPLDDSDLVKAADTNHDGKVSEEELGRYQEPLTYRAHSEDAATKLADSSTAFSLNEVNRAYGGVSTAALAAA